MHRTQCLAYKDLNEKLVYTGVITLWGCQHKIWWPNIKKLWWWEMPRMEGADLSVSLISRWGGEINSSLPPEESQLSNPSHMGSIKYQSVLVRKTMTPTKWSWELCCPSGEPRAELAWFRPHPPTTTPRWRSGIRNKKQTTIALPCHVLGVTSHGSHRQSRGDEI